MAGTWPAQFLAQLWCPKAVLEEFGVRLEEAFFDPDFAELLIKTIKLQDPVNLDEPFLTQTLLNY